MAKQDQNSNMMITILGPTATGKTRLAAVIAGKLDGEIISADSRQVYRGMDMGTGKDYEDYLVENRIIPYHLVDIVDPGYEYNVFEFQEDFLRSWKDIIERGKTPVLCGGTGMYLEAALSGYKLQKVPENSELRKKLSDKSLRELNETLSAFRDLHNITDSTNRERTIRAIEIAAYETANPKAKQEFPEINHHIFGVYFERQVIRDRITSRLKKRLESGMTDEVERLLQSGLKPDQLIFYGLEYRYVTEYVTGKISRDEMFRLLNTAIHQFAKRQMTWFRRMEKRGFAINWIDGTLSLDDKTNRILQGCFIPNKIK